VDALIFAAGLGTRLAPLTDRCPKALVEVGGVPMLGHVARRLVAAGATRLVVNLHPFPEQVVRYVAAEGGFGVEVVFSHERERPLETGGGLRAAAPLLRKDGPFFLHNADVWGDLPLRALGDAHARRRPLATLAVHERDADRALLFDDAGLLGRVDRAKGIERRVRAARGRERRLAFAGVHVVEPTILGRLEEEGAFGILEPYLRLVAEGETILPFVVVGGTWVDVGRPEGLERARRLAEDGLRDRARGPRSVR
jgi:NDP-sugar pyrophosphorylase family protein